MHPGIGGSLTSVLSDLSIIWSNAIRQKINKISTFQTPTFFRMFDKKSPKILSNCCLNYDKNFLALLLQGKKGRLENNPNIIKLPFFDHLFFCLSNFLFLQIDFISLIWFLSQGVGIDPSEFPDYKEINQSIYLLICFKLK